MCIRVEWNVICDFRSCKNFLQVKKTSFLNKFFIIYNQNSVFYFQKFTEGSLQKEKFTNHANYAVRQVANLTWPELESAPGFRTLSERAATKVATQQHCFGQSRLRLPPPPTPILSGYASVLCCFGHNCTTGKFMDLDSWGLTFRKNTKCQCEIHLKYLAK